MTLLTTLLMMMIALATPPQIGDGSVFATVPEEPGFPEAAVIDRGRIYLTTQARFGTAGAGPSKIHIFNQGTGVLEDEIVVQGEVLEAEHALSGLAVDSQGRLYAIAVGSADFGILRFSRQGCHGAWTQEIYSTAWPSLGIPLPDGSGTIPPLPNSMVFDEHGTLLVTDSLQALIYEIPPGGGAPSIWFGPSPQLAPLGEHQLGANGIRLSPDREWVYVVYTGGTASNEDEIPSPGKVLRLPYITAPTDADLQTFWTFEIEAFADELAFTRHGDLYVSLAGLNAISILNVSDPDAASPTVVERQRITGPSGSAIPFMQPAGMAFHHRRLFVVNHAAWTQPSDGYFSILEVVVADQGDHEERPYIP